MNNCMQRNINIVKSNHLNSQKAKVEAFCYTAQLLYFKLNFLGSWIVILIYKYKITLK